MSRMMQLCFIVIISACMVMAQTIPQAPQGTTDILGAHNGYGRGCVMCHAPHSGAAGNNVTSADPLTGTVALWGQDLQPLYGKTFQFGATNYAVTLPAAGGTTNLSISDGATIVLLCLSCHDGVSAKVGMMHGQTVETLPIVGGNAPTLLGADQPGYLNDHPVGPSATFGCGGAAKHQWDCTLPTTGNMTASGMTGTASAQFLKNYGFAVSLVTTGGVNNTVTCTSCHNQHSENIYSGTMTGVAGNYQTMFFLRGYYVPNSGSSNANSVAQFCRQCHGGSSNEMEGQMSISTQ